MKLKSVQEGPIHISHFMHLVSAYVPSKERVTELAKDIECALLDAKADNRTVTVSQDSNEFMFVVYPSGTITLYGSMGSYVVDEEAK